MPLMGLLADEKAKEKKITELKDISIKTSKTEKQREKRQINKSEYNIQNCETMTKSVTET